VPPYRTAPGSVAAPSPRDSGIVGDIIEQFADPYAFLRELVQNAIDAGSPSIDVSLTHRAPTTALVRVRDRGVGMPRDVVEDGLLVLFRSTKENDDSTIGKFGVGFASVLAMRPSLIRVDTVFEGTRHVLHLSPDLSYELFDAGRARQSGTTVELEIDLPAAELPRFADACRESLERWCRHATVPISFAVTDAPRADGGDSDDTDSDGGDSSDGKPIRIDRPLGLDGVLAEVRATSSDGRTAAVVGLPDDGQPYLGLFNHGLTLYETREPLLGPIAVKVQDPHLGHTLSRDSVRRDDAYDRAIAFARRVAERELPAALVGALRDAAGGGDSAHFIRIATGILAADLDIARSDWVFPLIHETARRQSIGAGDLAARGGWVASRRSPMTRELADQGVPVVDLREAGSDAASLLRHVERVAKCDARDVHTDLTMVTTSQPGDSDRVLLDRLSTVFDRVHRRPAAIELAELDGALQGSLWVGTASEPIYRRPARDLGEGGERDDDGRACAFFESRHLRRDPFRIFGRGTLILNTMSAAVRRARERAVEDSVVAADLLARAVLLERDDLDPKRSDKLLAHTLDALSERTA